MPTDYVSPMTLEEHEMTVAKLVSTFEDMATAEEVPRFTIDNVATCRFIITHWVRSAKRCAEADLKPNDFNVVCAAIEKGDALDGQMTAALRSWPMTWATTLLPDVETLSEIPMEGKEQVLEKAESAEWSARLATFEAKLNIDHRKAIEISNGLDLLKDALDWLATSKRVKQAQMARDLVEENIGKSFPVVTVNDFIDLPGELSHQLMKVDELMPMTTDTCGATVKVKQGKRLVVIHFDLNVPGVTLIGVGNLFLTLCWIHLCEG